MAVIAERNQPIVDEFRANEGRVGGGFAGAPMVLLHHRGKRSGQDYISPMMYLRDEDDPQTIYVFASAAGRPNNPSWYYNAAAADTATVEVGTETYGVTVRELHGDERDRIFAIQASRYPAFADYEQRTAGVRTIPVLALRRS